MELSAEGIVILVQDLVAYFYADDRLVALTQSERLQRSFEILTKLLDQIGIQENVWKTVSMA